MLAQTGNPQDVKKDRGLEHIKLSVFFSALNFGL
jgi:hypothetical protein